MQARGEHWHQVESVEHNMAHSHASFPITLFIGSAVFYVTICDYVMWINDAVMKKYISYIYTHIYVYILYESEHLIKNEWAYKQ